jgi:hypothetical protein
MKTIFNGYGLIAVACLLTARPGAEATVLYAADTGTVREEQVFEGLSVGIFFEDPADLNIENWLDEASAFDSSIPPAWSLTGINSFEFHADCLRHNYDLIKTRQLLQSLSFYYGLGGRMKLKEMNAGKEEDKDDDARLGMRSPLGISYVFQEKSVELFAEVVPILDVLPETRLGVGVGVGARYYFSLL